MRTQQGRMRRQVSRLVSRTTLGLITAVAALALVVPVAGATPESDAGAAIDQAWTAAGGDTSALGARDGGVYAAGNGFGQNFAGGAIFYSPDTGAKIMFGAILDKYRALGGPADSDLGFPNIDEGPGRVSPASRNTTFSAADRPVIFWTPDTGAWVVRGAINAAWDRLGGSSGVLGVPVADETYDGDVVSQNFSTGQVTFDSRTKSFTTEPPDLAGQLGDVTIPGDVTSAINAAYRAAGGAAGPLGARQGDQFTIDPDGAGQAFAGGQIFYSPATGAHVVSGAILEKYESAGGPTGDLGLPNAAEADGGVPDSRVSSFAASDNPVIFWTADHGAVIVRGAMKAAWDKLGGAAGALGVPESDQTADGDKVSQKFSGGQLSWDAKTNTFTTDPANLAESLGGLEVPTQAPATPAVPNPPKDNAFAFHTWWLWWIIPLALLVLASVVALMSTQRRRAARAFDGEAESDAAHVYRAPDDRSRWSTPVADTWQETEAPAAPRWGAAGGTETPAEHELFTHRGAHEAADDQDAVDTAPTRVQSGDLADERVGRHAAEPRPGWNAVDEDAYIPAPGSLFAPVYGAAPPPAQPRAQVVDPDLDDEDLVDDDFDDEDLVEPVDDDDEEPEFETDEDDVDDEDLYAEPDDQEPDDDEVADEELDDEELSDKEPDDREPDDEEPGDAEHAELPAIHLPLADPDEAPDGYPVKGRMSTGTYHTPDSARYDEVVAEIWFTDAQHAEANGFTPAD